MTLGGVRAGPPRRSPSPRAASTAASRSHCLSSPREGKWDAGGGGWRTEVGGRSLTRRRLPVPMYINNQLFIVHLVHDISRDMYTRHTSTARA